MSWKRLHNRYLRQADSYGYAMLNNSDDKTVLGPRSRFIGLEESKKPNDVLTSQRQLHLCTISLQGRLNTAPNLPQNLSVGWASSAPV